MKNIYNNNADKLSFTMIHIITVVLVMLVYNFPYHLPMKDINILFHLDG